MYIIFHFSPIQFRLFILKSLTDMCCKIIDNVSIHILPIRINNDDIHVKKHEKNQILIDFKSEKNRLKSII